MHLNEIINSFLFAIFISSLLFGNIVVIIICIIS
nr:MAG TPA: hypothetical protein [Caudoviricetes sp.]